MIQNKIVGIAGEQGCGKTTVLTKLGYIAYRNNMKIYSTYHVNYNTDKDNPDIKDYYPIGHLEDIKTMHGGPNGGVFLGDELYQWLFSRSSQSELNKAISMVLMVARKRGMSIIYTSHHPMHIDVMLRRITNIWVIPHMIPVRQLDDKRIEEIADNNNIDPFYVKRYYRKKLKSSPRLWMIHCDLYNSLNRHIGTFTLRNLPSIFTMFDTTEEINPLDTKGKPEYLWEKGMELELETQKRFMDNGFIVERKPHSGKGSDSHADMTASPKTDPSIKYYIDCCKTHENKRLYKTGVEMKALLEETQKDTKHTAHALIVFPYNGDLWYLPIQKNDYYLDYTSYLAISYDLKQFIKPLDELLMTPDDPTGNQETVKGLKLYGNEA